MGKNNRRVFAPPATKTAVTESATTVSAAAMVAVSVVALCTAGGVLAVAMIAAALPAKNFAVQVVRMQMAAGPVAPTKASPPRAMGTSGELAFWPMDEDQGTVMQNVATLPGPQHLNFAIQPADLGGNVRWLPAAEGGLEFLNPVQGARVDLVPDADTVGLNAAMREKNTFTFELWAAPANITQQATLFAIGCSVGCTPTADGRVENNFYILQDGADVRVGLRNSQDNDRNPAATTVVVVGKLVANAPNHIIATLSNFGTDRELTVWVNQSVSIHRWTDPVPTLANWENSSAVLAGPGPGTRWIGKVYLAAIYKDPLPVNLMTVNFNAGFAPCVDNDKDGFGNPGSGLCTWGGFTDCDDNDFNVRPWVPIEVCDGKDNNCNGLVDELSGFADVDKDAWGDPDVGISWTCEGGLPADGYAVLSGDCNDADPAVYPGAGEQCDGKDNDCNKIVDDGGFLWFRDADSDGYGSPETTIFSCSATVGYTRNSGDCNDGDPAVHPGAVEMCNGDTMDDCSAATPDGASDPRIGEGCDGTDADLCLDGAKACVGGMLVCVDDAASGVDLCNGVNDATTEDCNVVTLDGSGDPSLGAACDGADADLCKEGTIACTGGALTCNDANDVDRDLCNGVNNVSTEDCNVATPDGSSDPGVGAACDGTDADLCKDGIQACVAGVLACNDNAVSGVDLCNGVNNVSTEDCNVATPDGSNDPGVGVSCDGPDADRCKEGVMVCTGGALTCSDTTGNTVEICDNVDNDCDGSTDEGCDDDRDGRCDARMAKAAVIVTACSRTPAAAVVGDDCDDAKATVNPDAVEICDNVNNDCDGSTDEGCDDDNDNYCDATMAKAAGVRVNTCTATPTAATAGNDCNDAMAAVRPGAAELCDGVDNNCNNRMDEVCTFRRGDANGDGWVDLTDAVTTLGALYGWGPALTCNDAADADNNGQLEGDKDPIYTLSWLFLGGPVTSDPGPFSPGLDPPPDDALYCATPQQ
ncbi:MAG: putative metal-binding motif-containing protein [Patescibacteria group bacterium]|nr:putative metal-binding motif-containing protein [Patescibacteria group bacterium]